MNKADPKQKNTCIINKADPKQTSKYRTVFTPSIRTSKDSSNSTQDKQQQQFQSNTHEKPARLILDINLI